MNNLKVLLVDDEEEFVKTLAERLEMRDLQSDKVYDGEVVAMDRNSVSFKKSLTVALAGGAAARAGAA